MTAKRDKRLLDNLSTVKKGPYTIWVGVDPGASGGIAILGGYDNQHAMAVTLHKMPESENRILQFFRELSQHYASLNYPMRVCCERLTGYVTASRTPAAHAFKLGVNYGHLRASILGAWLPLWEPTAGQWQQALGIAGREVTVTTDDNGKKTKVHESTTSFKNRLKIKAQELYPEVKVTLAVADALLIAHYCKEFIRP